MASRFSHQSDGQPSVDSLAPDTQLDSPAAAPVNRDATGTATVLDDSALDDSALDDSAAAHDESPRLAEESPQDEDNEAASHHAAPQAVRSNSASRNGRSQGRPETRSELGSRGRLATLTGVRVAATGSFVPERVVKNEDLAALGYDADWILQRTGIRERRHAEEGVASSDVAYEAAKRCLENAGVKPRDVDLIVVATMTPDMPSPSTACFLQSRLSAPAPAMDVSAACAGFMYALITGMQFVHSGCHQRVLVVGADVMTRIVDPSDRKTFPLFGDGAGAVLLTPGTRGQGLQSYCLGADGCGADLLWMPGGGSRRPASRETLADGSHFLQMEGRSVFKWAVRMITDSVQEVLTHAGLTVNDVDHVAWHQANMRILDAACSNLGLPREKLLVNVDRYGNTSAGSIPLALDEAFRDDLIQPGDRVLLSGFGAGLAWGTAVLQW